MSLIFSRAATARILDCTSEDIRKLEIWHTCIYVQAKGKRPTFLSKTKFYQEFTRFRQEGAKDCVVRSYSNGTYPGIYEVLPEGPLGSWYAVRLFPHWQTCSCPDYQKQRESNLSGPCCKHLYAVLNQLGHSDLESYIRFNQVPVRPQVTVGTVNLPAKYRHISVV